MSVEPVTSTAYPAAGLGGRLSPGERPAVVVVDLALGFTDPACPLGSNLDAVVAATRRLLDAARAAGAPVVFTTIALAADGQEGSLWRQKMPALSWLTEGSRWVELDPRLGRVETEPVVVKRAASGFAGTGLAALLTTWSADSLVVCGATTSGCVRATAVDAAANNFRVIVAQDACFDRSAFAHAANLFDIHMKYGDVVTTAELLAMLPATVAQPAGGH